MATYSIELEQWVNYVRELNQDQLPAVAVPLHVLFGEAVDVSKFFDKYWEIQLDDKGNVVRLGLESAVPKDGKQGGVGRLSAKTGEEILSLQRAGQEAQTHYLLTVEKNGASPMARGRFLLGEIMAALGWYFDDGIEDDKDQMLARVDAAHADDPETHDALASALDDYAHLAELHRDGLDGLGGFSAATIDEARTVAAELRKRPAQVMALSAEARQALDLRNKVVSVLLDRMNLVRAAARFVFRSNPEIVREATSAYLRRKRAADRRAKNKPVETQPAAPGG